MLFICKYLTFCLLLFAIFCNKARSDDLAQSAENGTQLAADQADGGFVYDDNTSKKSESLDENSQDTSGLSEQYQQNGRYKYKSKFANIGEEFGYTDSNPYRRFPDVPLPNPNDFVPNPRYGLLGHGKKHKQGNPTTANVLLSFAKYNVKSSEFNLTPSDELKIRTNDTSYAPTGVSNNNVGMGSGISIGLKYIDHMYTHGPGALQYGLYLDYDSATSNVDRYSKDVGGASTITKFTYSGPHLSAGAHLGITLFDRISIYGFAGPAISRMQTFGASGYIQQTLDVHNTVEESSKTSYTKVLSSVNYDFNQDGTISDSEKNIIKNYSGKNISLSSNMANTKYGLLSSGVFVDIYTNNMELLNLTYKNTSSTLDTNDIYKVQINSITNPIPYLTFNNSIYNLKHNESTVSYPIPYYTIDSINVDNKISTNSQFDNVNDTMITNTADVIDLFLDKYAAFYSTYKDNKDILGNIGSMFSSTTNGLGEVMLKYNVSYLNSNFNVVETKTLDGDVTGIINDIQKLVENGAINFNSDLSYISTIELRYSSGSISPYYDIMSVDKSGYIWQLQYPTVTQYDATKDPSINGKIDLLDSSGKPIFVVDSNGEFVLNYSNIFFGSKDITNQTNPTIVQITKDMLSGGANITITEGLKLLSWSQIIQFKSEYLNYENTDYYYNLMSTGISGLNSVNNVLHSNNYYFASGSKTVQPTVSYDILYYLAKQQTQYSLTAQNNYMELSSRNLVGVKYGMGAMLNLGNYFSVGVEYANYSYNYKDSPSYMYDFAALNGSSVAVDVYKGLSFDNSINMKTSKIMLMVNLF